MEREELWWVTAKSLVILFKNRSSQSVEVNTIGRQRRLARGKIC